jgi:hypothetical protein
MTKKGKTKGVPFFFFLLLLLLSLRAGEGDRSSRHTGGFSMTR